MAVVPLFRLAAVNAKRTSSMGDIVLIYPLPFAFLTALAVILAGLVLAFLTWGTYTKRSTVAGQLVPDSGLIKVFTQQPGIVLAKQVAEGQQVKRGEVLFVVSSERTSSTQGDTQATISNQVQARQRSLREELTNTQSLQKKEHETLVRKVSALQAELSNLDRQIKGQRNRVQAVQEIQTRYQDLAGRGFISKDALQQRQGESFDQHAHLQSLERTRISVGRELEAAGAELISLRPKHDNQLAHIERSVTSAEQELIESEAKRRLVITAPESGTATAVASEVGQVVDASRALVSIVPVNAKLQAHLHAPSKAVGFIKPGDAVLLRFTAFPYQKFGQHKGTVASVSRTALPSHELTGVGSAPGGAGEPVYRVTVSLASQTVYAYGKPQPLQSGMMLEADVLQDKRRLYEWVLEPLYSPSGKL